MQEMAWESEKKRVAVAKLRTYFLGDVEVEHIVLHAFRWPPLLLYITSHLPLPASPSEQTSSCVHSRSKHKRVSKAMLPLMSHIYPPNIAKLPLSSEA